MQCQMCMHSYIIGLACYFLSCILSLCRLGNFSCLFCCLLTLYKVKFSKTIFRNIIKEAKGLDPNQDRHSVCPDLGPTYLQRLSADDFVCLFRCFTSQVNSYGHGGTVSSPNHTFPWAGLHKQLTSTLCTYFHL